MSHAASHVLMVTPVDLRYNAETADSNAFMRLPTPEEARALSEAAPAQHAALRELLIAQGVAVTVARGNPDTPDAAFCNNWFSTHRKPGGRADGTLVLYPLLAPSRRLERRDDLVALLRSRYGRVIDLSGREREDAFLESTGSLVLDPEAGIAYAALSPRTDRELARAWADALDYRLVTFTAADAQGVPYYHTNVMMFVGHGLAGVCLESIADPGERRTVERTLGESGRTVLGLTRAQVVAFAGNCLALANHAGEPLFVMSSAAYAAFTPDQLALLARHGRILHTDLSAFETLGGGSARCLLGELM